MAPPADRDAALPQNCAALVPGRGLSLHSRSVTRAGAAFRCAACEPGREVQGRRCEEYLGKVGIERSSLESPKARYKRLQQRKLLFCAPRAR